MKIIQVVPCLCVLLCIDQVFAVSDDKILLKLSRLDELVMTLLEENTLLKNEVGILKNEVGILKTESKMKENRIFELEEESSHLKQDLARAMVESKMMREDIRKLAEKCSMSIQDDVTRIRRIIPPTTNAAVTQQPKSTKIGFFAVMTAHQEHLGLLQPILFPTTITNEGNGYDSKTSVFKAPTRGLYFFSANLMSHYNEDFEAQLVKDGIVLVYAFVGNGDTHGVGTLSGVLFLEAGNDVWIRTHNNSAYNDGNVRVYGYAWSWFSGFLIAAY